MTSAAPPPSAVSLPGRRALCRAFPSSTFHRRPRRPRSAFATPCAASALSRRRSCRTYGAGGGTQERTFKAIDWVRGQTAQEPAAHLTCVGASRQDRKSVVSGKSVSVRVDLGGRRVIKKKKNKPPKT